MVLADLAFLCEKLFAMNYKFFYLILSALIVVSFSQRDRPNAPSVECRVGQNEPVSAYQALMWETKRREQGAVFHDQVYWDKGGKGSWAVGYGIRITPAEAKYWRKRGGITKAEAHDLTVKYFEKTLPWVNEKIPGLERNQQLAVASLVYTMGPESLMKTKLWKRLVRKETGKDVVRLWRKTACGFWDRGRYHYRDNLARCRKVESAMWASHTDPNMYTEMQNLALEARSVLLSRL